jgi:hypothetical protein
MRKETALIICVFWIAGCSDEEASSSPPVADMGTTVVDPDVGVARDVSFIDVPDASVLVDVGEAAPADAGVGPIDAALRPDADGMCDPDSPPVCNGRWRRVCRPDGSGYDNESCAEGAVCQEGTCVSVQANIVLMVDTSGSMNQLIADGADPTNCDGPGCPPWDFPECDDPAEPKTRLGRVKAALRSVVTSDAAAEARLALQRFPQTEGLHPIPSLMPNCVYGWYANHDGITRHNEEKQVGRESLEQYLHEVIPVPIRPDGTTDVDGILQEIDFTEEILETGADCRIHRDCPGGFCFDGGCFEHTDPELRGVGLTPLGQSLFYAGEYFRHYVVKEGLACANDADCGSDDYHCLDGACHDPLFSCRPNVVVLFSDGHETEYDDPDSFFNPRIQAKRLHYGLGCVEAADCLNGAECLAGVCAIPGGPPPATVCMGSDRPCQADAECPTYRCGFGMPECPGMCAPAGFEYVDPDGHNVLRNDAGVAFSLTIHVVDASGQPDGNSLTALAGGGTHASVDFADPNALIESFHTLIGDKPDVSACE